MTRPSLESMVFVFGSNKAGIHGAGSAKHAYRKRNAEWGVGEGLTGQCYALPTKGYKIEFISLDEIKKSVDKFLETAERYQDQLFQVTQVGCGLGGWSAADIAPLFKNAPQNCYFDSVWRKYLGPDYQYWGTL